MAWEERQPGVLAGWIWEYLSVIVRRFGVQGAASGSQSVLCEALLSYAESNGALGPKRMWGDVVHLPGPPAAGAAAPRPATLLVAGCVHRTSREDRTRKREDKTRPSRHIHQHPQPAASSPSWAPDTNPEARPQHRSDPTCPTLPHMQLSSSAS